MKRKKTICHPWASVSATRGSRGMIIHNKALYTARSPIKWGMTLVILVSLSTPSFAYTTCVGGSIITRNEYGSAPSGVECTATTCPVHGANETAKTFCKSDKVMNWWSAFNWCEANARQLASFENMCPGITPTYNSATGACPALQGTSSTSLTVWSAVGRGTNMVIAVNLSSGSIGSGTTSAGGSWFRHNPTYALCE